MKVRKKENMAILLCCFHFIRGMRTEAAFRLKMKMKIFILAQP